MNSQCILLLIHLLLLELCSAYGAVEINDQ